MQDIRRTRLEAGLSQSQLANALGIPRRTLAHYELSRRSWPAEVLRQACHLLGLNADLTPQLTDQECRQLGTHGLPLPLEAEGQSWSQLPVAYPELYARLGKDRRPEMSFRDRVRCDSQLEALAWTQLFHYGALARLANPLRLGFSTYPLTTSRGEGLVRSLCPAFFHPQHWLVFPQLLLVVAGRVLRPDALLLDWLSPRPRWCLLEIDGPRHQPDLDARRDAALRLPVYRFSSSEVLRLGFAGLLRQRLLEHPFGFSQSTGVGST